MAFRYKNTFQNQSWSSYQPVGDHVAGEAETNSEIRHIPLSSLGSLHSFTGVRDTSYTGLAGDAGATDIPRSARSGGHQSTLRWWLPEIISSCISIAALVALIVVLREYDGRGLDDLRLPKWLTLNGLVAVIATINRVAMVAPVEAAISQEVWLWFSPNRRHERVRSRLEDLEISDNASRGAWGSFAFLWRGGKRWLSHLGAIVLILSLAFGAFTQQLISIVVLPVSNSTITLSPGNIPYVTTWQDSNGAAAENGLSTTLSMKASIYNGMLEGGIAPLPVFCPTGNCTFPVTPTVAVCGECKTVPYTTSCNSTNCEYTMSTGTIITLANWYSQEVYEGVNFQVIPRNTTFYGTRRLDLAEFDVFGAPYDTYAGRWDNSSTTSSACSLWMCVNAISVTTESGTQTQRVVATLSELSHAISDTDISDGGNVFNFSSLPAEMNPVDGVIYSVGLFAYIALSEYIPPLTNGSTYIQTESNIPSSDTVEAIWNGTVNGLDRWVKNLALSMTNVIRTSEPATAPQYNGTAYQSGIKVRWEWLALPLAMVLMSLFLLITVMIKTSRSNIKPWKGSPLALLMTDADDSIKQGVGAEDIVAYKGVEKAVGGRHVMLRNQPSGRLIFREAT